MSLNQIQQLEHKSGTIIPASPTRRRILMHDALEVEQHLMNRVRDPKATNLDVCSLATAFCRLMECIRIMRNKPLPGQLQPSLDPASMAKRLRKLRATKAINIAPESIREAVETPKESLKSAGG